MLSKIKHYVMDSACDMQVWSAWDVVAPVQPQLYLYSSADALIPPSEVQLFMQQQVLPSSLAAFTNSLVEVTASCLLIVSLDWCA